MSEESKQKEAIAAKIQADAVREASIIQADAAREASRRNTLAIILVAIISVLGSIVVTIVGLKNKSPIPEITSSPPLTFTSTPYICPFQGQTDNETIVNLIQAEAVAVNTKDLDIILKIFAANAEFYDYVTKPPRIWNGPHERYKEDLFKTEFSEVKHFDILPAGLGIDGDRAYYISGSMGYYKSEGTWEYFFNGSSKSMPPTPTAKFGSDHWVLQKNNNGCWVIIRMEFNAGHEEFPP